jgi:hypothetical protein
MAKAKLNPGVEIKVCMGTGGVAAGGAEVLDAFREHLATGGIPASVSRNCASH